MWGLRGRATDFRRQAEYSNSPNPKMSPEDTAQHSFKATFTILYSMCKAFTGKKFPRRSSSFCRFLSQLLGGDKGRAGRTGPGLQANSRPGSLDMNAEWCSHNTVTKRDLLENSFPRGIMSFVPWNAPEQF